MRQDGGAGCLFPDIYPAVFFDTGRSCIYPHHIADSSLSYNGNTSADRQSFMKGRTMYKAQATITRRLESAMDGLQSEFRALCDRQDFERKLEALKAADSRSDRSSKLRSLCDMFDLCGIAYERGRDYAYYERLVKKSDIPTSVEIADRMLIALYHRYEDYPAPEEYMQRMVDRLCRPEDDWGHDSLRLRILKQFIKYGDYLRDAGYGGRKAIRDYVRAKGIRISSDADVLDGLDDGVFNFLITAKKAQKKPGAIFGLLKTADDLASGSFRVEGATKKSLYLFAMVYDMTYYSGNDSAREFIDPETDIEINLFRDYYCNNLMRYISETYRKRINEYEPDPSGQGINYKNFAEMIYLYYIAREYSPLEKIRLSSQMIGRVQRRQFKRGKLDSRAAGGTAFFRNIFSEDILSMSEDQFESFICSHYDCDTYAGSYEAAGKTKDMKTSEIQMETEQVSAFNVYRSILSALKDTGIAPENCNYGLWFTDVAAFRKKGYGKICDRHADIDPDQFDEFIELLFGINSFAGVTAEEEAAVSGGSHEKPEPSVMKTRALFISDASAMTRTSLIVAYYYYYNAFYENDPRFKWMSFEEVYNHFKQHIDEKLAAAYYQPLSGRNIFDVMIAFSAYAYQNL